MPNWQDAKEHPPKQEGQYLVIRKGYTFPQMRKFENRKFLDFNDREDLKVTHWQEIKEQNENL